MGNTGQGYDVCSVFDLCLLPRRQPLLAVSFFLLQHHHDHPLSVPPLSLFFSFPHCHCKADFLLSCSNCVVVKHVQRGLVLPLQDQAPLALQGPEHGEVMTPSATPSYTWWLQCRDTGPRPLQCAGPSSCICHYHLTVPATVGIGMYWICKYRGTLCLYYQLTKICI